MTEHYMFVIISRIINLLAIYMIVRLGPLSLLGSWNELFCQTELLSTRNNCEIQFKSSLRNECK